jgi:tRNA nucleotidyltransferase/poly(A) polymerase
VDTSTLLTHLSFRAHRERRTAYLVGGCVRDLLLGRPVQDFDIALEGKAFAWARDLADAWGGSFVPLDDERDIARVVFKGEPAVQVDVVPLGGTIEENLAQRDLTINAMALPLGQWVDGSTALSHDPIDSLTHFLIDPFEGLSDLRARWIRLVRPQALVDDPLRLLRVVRFAAQLGFAIEESTGQSVREHAPLLGRVAAERVREEFFAVFGAASCVPYVRWMREAGLLQIVVPELSAPSDGVERGLRVVASVERLIAEVSRGQAQNTLLKFAALLTPLRASVDTMRTIARRLRLSNKATRLLSAMARYHDQPRALVRSGDLTGRAKRRFFRAVGEAAGEVLLLALAVEEAGDGLLRAFVNELRRDYLEGAPCARPTRFVRGDEIMARYGIPAGPRIRELIEGIEEAEAEGEVASREAAWQWLDRTLERSCRSAESAV